MGKNEGGKYSKKDVLIIQKIRLQMHLKPFQKTGKTTRDLMKKAADKIRREETQIEEFYTTGK